MTINDLTLNERALLAKKKISEIDYLMREGKEHKLFLAFLEARNACDDALERMNRMQRAHKG